MAGTFISFILETFLYHSFLIALCSINYFNITNHIKFYDHKTTSILCDDDLVEYVEQFRSSAGWNLGVLDDLGEILQEQMTLSPFSLPNENTISKHAPDSVSSVSSGIPESSEAQIYSIPYRTLSCHGIEDFSRNVLQQYVSSTVTAEVFIYIRILPNICIRLYFLFYNLQILLKLFNPVT